LTSNLEDTASRLARFADDGDGPGTVYLLVVDSDSSTICHLPRTGSVVIGRDKDVELRVQHASVSRRHATIRVDDGIVRVADLGSHNGTRVNGELVEGTRSLASGDVVTVGDVVLVVHFSAPALVARSAYAEAGWRRRLAEELVRAIAFKRSLAVAVIAGVRADEVPEVSNALRLIDVVGTTDDCQMLVLMPELARSDARELIARAIGVVVGSRAGLAECPTDACDADTILLTARAALRRAAAGTIAEASQTAQEVELGSRRVLVGDPAMSRVFALLERVAATDLAVLITGETGVGKENAAYAVHHWSKRTGPFIAVNCAALGPETLVDAELFGYDKGAFTGAAAAKAGLFETASGGTVFLDEVGELPLPTQAKLLRALESKRITRLGEVRERPIDVRVVSATNRSLESEAAGGRFRQDLFFRLSGATVIVPPLRDRRCEIPLLARAFLADVAARSHRPPMTISPDAMQVLLTYGWPGNVRELKHTMEYAAAAAPDETIEPLDLPERLGGSGTVGSTATPSEGVPTSDGKTTFRPISDELRELERRRMAEALAASDGVKTRAAQLIDMPIRTFTLKLKQYKL
jgi:two-component system, NtrC family, response regulator AtoC